MSTRKSKSRKGAPLNVALESLWLTIRDTGVTRDGVDLNLSGRTASGRLVQVTVTVNEYELRCGIGKLRGAMSSMAQKAVAYGEMLAGWVNHSTEPIKGTP